MLVLMDSFGAVIRSARREKKLSLRALAKLIDVNFTYLSKIENDDLPPPAIPKIQALAAHLDLDPDELYLLAKRLPDDLVEAAVEPEVPAILRAMKDMSVESRREILEWIQQRGRREET